MHKNTRVMVRQTSRHFLFIFPEPKSFCDFLVPWHTCNNYQQVFYYFFFFTKNNDPTLRYIILSYQIDNIVQCAYIILCTCPKKNTYRCVYYNIAGTYILIYFRLSDRISGAQFLAILYHQYAEVYPPKFCL